jgi:DNA-binding MarR family transcriptional regulator
MSWSHPEGEQHAMNRVLDSLRNFQLAQAAAFRRAGEALGVSETALSTLNTLVAAHVESGVSMKDLAHDVGVSPAVLTGIVDRLEEKGWAKRQLNASDRRSIVVIPTLREDSAVAEVLRALDEPLRKVANSIPEDTAAVVRRLAAAMEEELRNFDPTKATRRRRQQA